MSYTNVLNVAKGQAEWLKALSFYEDELYIMENRLAEVASKNTSFEARQGIEHFQNQFVIQRNQVDELKHDIREFEHRLTIDAEKHQGHVDNGFMAGHNVLLDKFEIFEKLMNELRHEYNNYLTKWF
jgi:hypothetical protein